MIRPFLPNWFIALTIAMILSNSAKCDDLFANPYLLRLAASLTRSGNFAPASGLQATAAHSAGWSVNPASDDVNRRDAGVATTLTSLNVFAESGAWFNATAVTASTPLPQAGTLSLAYARTETPDTTTEQGFNNFLRSNEFFWGYSRKISDTMSLGAEARFTTADIQEETKFTRFTF